jgi:hypothetical protein
MPQLPGCPEPLAIEAVEDAVIRFCEDSLIWRVNITPSDAVIGFDEYTIDSGTGTRVILPTYVLYDGRTLYVKTEAELDAEDSAWRTADPGVPTAYVVPRPDLLRLNRVPEATITAGIKIGCAIKPLQGQTSFDDNQIYQDWKTAIESGALSVRMADSEKKWSSEKKAASNGKEFNFQIQRARARSEKGNTYKSTTVKSRAWV